MAALVALAITGALLSGCAGLTINGSGSSGGSQTPATPPDKTLNVMSGSENKALEPIIKDFEAANGVTVNMKYLGSVDIMNALREGGTGYDAAWPANSIWLSMGDTKHIVKQAKSIMVTPVVFGVRQSKAQELGWVGKDVTVDDILKAVEAKKLSFIMTSATQSNSGASAYLGFISALLGHPDQITKADLAKPALQDDIRKILGGVNRTSGSSDWLKDLYLSAPDRYDAMVNYEALVIEANQKLVAQGKEPLYVVYPKDGLALADSPLAYVDHADPAKQALFQKFQDYLLTPAVQKKIEALGRRTELGGVIAKPDTAVFNPAWGIQTTKPLNVIRYPTPDVIEAALNLYQTELKKPSATVFALDFSGSMEGEGVTQVKKAMGLLLQTNEAKKLLLQMGPKDVVIVIPFSDSPQSVLTATGPTEAAALLGQVQALKVGGSTDIYSPVIEGLGLLSNYDPAVYNVSAVLMTDGMSNAGKTAGDFRQAYAALNKDIPVYSIMFGSADPKQLDALAQTTRGSVFDGRTDLIAAFKKVRGFN
jgi:Ca-activated chloride channel family protein